MDPGKKKFNGQGQLRGIEDENWEPEHLRAFAIAKHANAASSNSIPMRRGRAVSKAFAGTAKLNSINPTKSKRENSKNTVLKMEGSETPTPVLGGKPERESSLGLRRDLVASVVQEIIDRAKHEYELAQAAVLPQRLAEMREQIEEAMTSEANARLRTVGETRSRAPLLLPPPCVTAAPTAPWPTVVSPMDLDRPSDDQTAAACAPAPHPPPPLKLIQSRKTVADEVSIVQNGGSRDVKFRKRHYGLYRVPSHPPLPQYKAWSSVRRNVLCLESIGQRLFCTEAETGETIPASDDEMELIAGDLVPEVHHQNKEVSPRTFSTRESSDSGGGQEPALDGLAKDATNRAIEAILKELDDSEESSLLKTLCGRYYDVDMCDEKGFSLLHIVADCLGVNDVEALRRRVHRLRAQLEGKGTQSRSETDSHADALHQHKSSMDVKKDEESTKLEEHFYSTFCRICRAYACRIHNYPHPLPHWWPRQTSKSGPASAPVDPPTPEPCGPHCFRTLISTQQQSLAEDASTRQPSCNNPLHQSECSSESDNGDDHGVVQVGLEERTRGRWTQWDTSMLEVGLSMYVKGYSKRNADSMLDEEDLKDAAYCSIATLLGTKTCAQVYKKLLPRVKKAPVNADGAPMVKNAMEGGEQCLENAFSTADNAQSNSKPQQRRKAKSQKRRILPVAYARLKRSVDDLWAQYEPCSCEGPCNEGCPCFGDVTFCEKFCGCDPKKCNNRFPGCRCRDERGRRCLTKNCPCMAAGRECDPDLCGGCIPTLAGAHAPGTQCNNFRLRLNQKRRVLMGRSNVQGWGAFLQSSAIKDEYIGEYCGELIDQKEADRRGRVYDHDDNSYLFNLNLKWVIDARHKGNKLRFANHSSEANCRAEIMMVDGDHRVAVFANRNIAPGEELFYNYRYAEHVAPEWAQE